MGRDVLPALCAHAPPPDAANYYYVVEEKGTTIHQPLVLNPSGARLCETLRDGVQSVPTAGRAHLVDQPHFDGKPFATRVSGQSLEELTNISATLPSLHRWCRATTTLDGSPELRRHPILDQLVTDLQNDPLALANYVINEIGLVDAIDYDTNYKPPACVNPAA